MPIFNLKIIMIPPFKTWNVKSNMSFYLFVVFSFFFFLFVMKNHISVTFATFLSKCSHELTISKLRTFFILVLKLFSPALIPFDKHFYGFFACKTWSPRVFLDTVLHHIFTDVPTPLFPSSLRVIDSRPDINKEFLITMI